MMVLALGEPGDRVHERDRDREGVERELALERTVDLGPPVRDGLAQRSPTEWIVPATSASCQHSGSAERRNPSCGFSTDIRPTLLPCSKLGAAHSIGSSSH